MYKIRKEKRTDLHTSNRGLPITHSYICYEFLFLYIPASKQKKI